MAYSGSDEFRNYLQDEIEGKLDKFSKKEEADIIEQADLNLTSLKSYSAPISFVDETRSDREYLDKFHLLNQYWVKKDAQRLLAGTRPIFLFTGLYCFIVLVIGGFEANNLINDYLAFNWLLLLSICILIFSLGVFFKTFNNSLCDQRLSNTLLSIIFVLLFVLSFEVCIGFPQNGLNLSEKPSYPFLLGLMFFIFTALLGFSIYLFRMSWNFILVPLVRNRIIKKVNNSLSRIQNKIEQYKDQITNT